MRYKIILLISALFMILLLSGCECKHENMTREVISEADCEHAGQTLLTCQDCGYTETIVDPPLGHDYSEWVITLAPDCFNDGLKARSCKRCNEVFREVIPSEGHTFTDWTVTLEPTCTRAGVRIRYCTKCNGYETESIPETGHTFMEWEVVTPATCTDEGEEMRECYYCGEEEHRSLPATGVHVYDEWVYLVQPDCTTDGARRHTCIYCDKQETEILPATGHSCEGWHTAKDATCTEDGFEEGYCDLCHQTITRVIPAKGHVTGGYIVIQEADCEHNGIEAKYCEVCHQYVDQFTIISPGHKYGDWVVTEEASCFKDGSRYRICSACGNKEVEAIPSAGAHTFGDWVIEKEATCDEPGSRSRECSVCHYIEREDIPVTEHEYGSWSTVYEATLTSDGERSRSCVHCGHTETERIPATAAMPQIYIYGDYTSATKYNEVTVEVVYYGENGEEFTCYATIHHQGGTSLRYPKKNYTIKFYTDETLDSKYKVDLGWGKESKYCMKANWIDCTHARNIVSCRLWGQGVETRPSGAITDRLAALDTNGGAVDGYPIMVYMNGSYYGLYTMNVPKDDWMFDMGDSETEAMITTNGWDTKFDSPILSPFTMDANGDYISGDWELKYFGTEDTTGDTEWVRQSMNDLINFVIDNDGDSFREGISQYLDVDSTIDYIIYLYALYMRDNAAKNMIWATYDGTVWFPTVYDQDATFGMVWDGIREAKPNAELPSVSSSGALNVNVGNANILWGKIMEAFPERFYTRYLELRNTVLSVENVIATLDEFVGEIPQGIYDLEASMYSSIPSLGLYDYDYIVNWYELRVLYMDTAMEMVFTTLIGAEAGAA